MKPLKILVVLSVSLLCLEAAPTSLNITEFVFGGTAARLGQFPMQVYVNYKGKSDGQNYHCGGTLISTTHVLTAAHCAEDMGSMKRIMVGAINRRYPAAGAQWRNIAEIFIHPEFVNNGDEIRNDIAVLKLQSPVGLNANVKLAKIVENDEQLLKSNTATVAGYGTYGFKGNTYLLSDYLRYAEISLYSFTYCNQAWWGELTESQVCAGSKGRGAGEGDSGGPLLVNYRGQDYQIGVTSFLAWTNEKQQNEQDKHPGVYARVSSYCDFIRTSTKGAAKCERLPVPTTTTKRTTTTTTTTTEAPLPPVQSRNFGKYIIGLTQLAFHDAESFCQTKKATLASFHKKGSENTVAAIFKRFDPKGAKVFWIGLYKSYGYSSEFQWLDWTPLDYTNWAPGFPDTDYNEECAAHSKGLWTSLDCNSKNYFVCYKK